MTTNLSAEAVEALDASKNWVNCSPYCLSSERHGRQDYLKEVVLADSPIADEILDELRSEILKWDNYAGD